MTYRETKTDLREKPTQAEGEYTGEEDHSDLLPKLLQDSYSLVSMTFRIDPYVIYDKRGLKVYEWSCGTTPNWLDVFEVCKKLSLV